MLEFDNRPHKPCTCLDKGDSRDHVCRTHMKVSINRGP